MVKDRFPKSQTSVIESELQKIQRLLLTLLRFARGHPETDRFLFDLGKKHNPSVQASTAEMPPDTARRHVQKLHGCEDARCQHSSCSRFRWNLRSQGRSSSSGPLNATRNPRARCCAPTNSPNLWRDLDPIPLPKTSARRSLDKLQARKNSSCKISGF